MRIKLLSEDQLLLPSRISMPHSSGSIDFIVDTGSADSIVGGVDCIRLKVPFNTVNLTEEIWWGDFPMRVGRLRNVSLWLRTEEEKLKVIRLPYIKVTPDFVKTKRGEPLSSPNVLGLDFFRMNKAKLFFDGESKEAYIEI